MGCTGLQGGLAAGWTGLAQVWSAQGACQLGQDAEASLSVQGMTLPCLGGC